MSAVDTRIPQAEPAMDDLPHAPAEQVDALILREQFARLDRSLVAPMLLMVLVALAHSASLGLLRPSLWAGALVLLFFLRRGHARAALRQPMDDTVRNYQRLYWTMYGGAIAVAIGFASGMWLLGNGQIDNLLYLRLMVMAGAAAVSLSLMGLHPKTYGAFLSVLTGLVILYVVTQFPAFPGGHLAFSTIVVLFAWMLFSRSRDERRQAQQGLQARLGQDLLVVRLREALTEQQSVRHSLEAKSSELEASNRKLSDMAIHDAMTGAFNRGHVQELLRQEVARFTRYRQSMCVLLLDIDHFKHVNDRYGHAMGDKVLREMSAAVLAGLREGDLYGRWGGEEFIIVLPNIGLPGALEAAERLRTDIAAQRIATQRGDEPSIGITVSIGVAEVQDGESADSLVERADAALYQAKASGRNRVVAAAPAPAMAPHQTELSLVKS